MGNVLKTYDCVINIISGSVRLGKLCYEIQESGYVEGYAGLTKEGNLISVLGNSINDESSLDNVVAQHDPSDTISAIKGLYDKYVPDGQDYIKQITAEMVSLSMNDPVNHPFEDVIFIETKLDKVIQKLSIGHWSSAKSEIALVTIEGALTQDIYDGISSYINNYVDNNY